MCSDHSTALYKVVYYILPYTAYYCTGCDILPMLAPPILQYSGMLNYLTTFSLSIYLYAPPSHPVPYLTPFVSFPKYIYCTRTFELYFPCRSLLLLGKSLQPLAALLGHYSSNDWKRPFRDVSFNLSGFPFNPSLTITYKDLCRWFRFAQLAKGKKFRP